MAIDPKKPLSRKEMYLAKAAGEGDSVPKEPWSREEYYLSKIAEGGGGGGGGDHDKNLVFYMSVDPTVTASSVSVYSDASCTTPISLKTFFSALRDGKSVWLQYRNGDGEEDSLRSFQIVTSSLTNVDTENAYNELAPSAVYYTGYTGWKHIGIYSVDPDATTGAFNISS